MYIFLFGNSGSTVRFMKPYQDPVYKCTGSQEKYAYEQSREKTDFFKKKVLYEMTGNKKL